MMMVMVMMVNTKILLLLLINLFTFIIPYKEHIYNSFQVKLVQCLF